MHLLQSRKSRDGWTRSAVDQQAAQCLGWTSIAIGLTELLATNQLKRTMGVDDPDGRTSAIIRAMGAREIMHGVGILAPKDPTPGVWARVLGDLLDGALLTLAATRTKRPWGMAAIFAAVTPVVLADMFFAPRLSYDKRHGNGRH